MAGAGPPRTVLYVHSSAGRYGADRQLALVVSHLDPDRYRALVVLPEHGPLVQELRAGGAEVHLRPGLAVLRRALFNPAGVARVTARAVADARGLAQLARARDASLVHSNTSVTLGGAAAARAARLPHVWHVREIYADFERWWPAYRRVLLRADAVACLSEATRAQLGDAANALVINEGLPAEATFRRPVDRRRARQALDLPPDALTCLFLGRLNSWKGQEVLARALAEPRLRERGAIGLIAGDAWPGEERYERELRARRSDLGLDDRLRLLGFRDDLDVLYGAADVVCVPSTRPEPLGLVALEAAAAAKCVVASDDGGLREIVRDGETGRLVPPGSASALAAALADLADDPGRRTQL